MINSVRQLLDFALIQSAAESYLHDLDFSDMAELSRRLKAGNNDPEKLGKSADDAMLPGATRFTDTQIDYFLANFDIVTHYPNDDSGFSATVFQDKRTGVYTLSFRSTEYQFAEDGGDWECDGKDGVDGEINNYGFGLGQLSSMKTFYANLKQGKI